MTSEIKICDHIWLSIGGRACPFEYSDKCSQVVYECMACGDVDYGEKGGPGYQDCCEKCPAKKEMLNLIQDLTYPETIKPVIQ